MTKNSEKQKLLNKLYQPFKKANKDCLLYCSGHTNIVFGEGDLNSKIMLIGEAPGKDEDEQGRPFVGRSGKLLNEVLSEANIQREKVFITNIVKCRPPNNKTPIIKNINKETLNLLRYQIYIIKPQIICTLGSIAAQVILDDTKLKITKIHGTVINKKNFLIIPTYHPAYILRNKTQKQSWIDDLKKAKSIAIKL